MVFLRSTYHLLLMVLLAMWGRGESEDPTCADKGGTCVPEDDNSCSDEVDYPGCNEDEMCCISSASFLSRQSDDGCDGVKPPKACKKKYDGVCKRECPNDRIQTGICNNSCKCCGCRIKNNCKNKHGHCIIEGVEKCNGRKKNSWCVGKMCTCCIPKKETCANSALCPAAGGYCNSTCPLGAPENRTLCEGKDCTCCFLTPPGDIVGEHAPLLNLWTELNQKGGNYRATGPYIDLREVRFNDVTRSIRGKGLWFLYEEVYFQKLLLTSASASITPRNLQASQYDKVSSVRYAGSDDMSMEILTLYPNQDYCGGSYIVVADNDYLFEFNDKTNSMAITGNSNWTVYEHYLYYGYAACIIPAEVDGFFYGYWNVADINMPDNLVSSVKKGCHSHHVFQFQPNKI